MTDEPAVPPSTSRHGASVPRGLDVPAGESGHGRFGRMFPSLRTRGIDIAAIDKLISAIGSVSGDDSQTIPAGYTYLGQFIDHDITFDPTSVLDKKNDPRALVNFRTPRLDLDSVYGSGPADQPFLYEWKDTKNRGVTLLIGENPSSDAKGRKLAEHDLQRNAQDRALIGDARNDENLIVSQLHLLVIRFHNAVVEHVRHKHGLEGPELFAEARRLVRWHYQWIVVDDFLRRVLGESMLASVLGPDGAVRREFYRPDGDPFIPVEFSAAAYRFGHSMVRRSYGVKPNTEQTFTIFGGGDDHLGGFRRLQKRFEIHWERFFEIAGHGAPQASRRLDANIALELFRLPADVAAEPQLARLNMRRARALRLPTGPAVAHAMGLDPLGLEQLSHAIPGFPAEVVDDVPLWLYVLCEAKVFNDGSHLGPVGGRIVAEVLIGLLEADADSYLGASPAWEPEPGFCDPDTKRFWMPELLAFAGYDPDTGKFPVIAGVAP